MDEQDLNVIRAQIEQITKTHYPGHLGIALLAILSGGISNYGIQYISPDEQSQIAREERRQETAERKAADQLIHRDIRSLLESNRECKKNVEWCKTQIWQQISNGGFHKKS